MLESRVLPLIGRHTDRFKKLYRGRASIERVFGNVTETYVAKNHKRRGLARVSVAITFATLTMLLDRLVRSRAGPEPVGA